MIDMEKSLGETLLEFSTALEDLLKAVWSLVRGKTAGEHPKDGGDS